VPDPDGLELIGGPEPRPVVIVEYDPGWPDRFESERARIAAALPHASTIDHIGSTSVPGLAAKAIIDIQVHVGGELDDAVVALESTGYRLRVREPGHRMLRTPECDVHIHLWTDPADERRHLTFRDWLRVDAADRALYERTKRELATHEWADMNGYADAKSDVVAAILARAEAWIRSTPGRVASVETTPRLGNR
jgi:GrpB-like predicted nucleotidyltransferase (UPF0157 family)